MKFIPSGVSTKFARTILETKKNSPTVMFGAGVVGMVGTVVLASKATLKLDSALDEIEKKQEMARELVAEEREEYGEKEFRKDMVVLKTQAVVRVGKLYTPAFVLGVVSVGLLTGSHVALSRRNVALTAAYAGLEKAYNEYRERVIKEYGEDKDRELRYGYEACEVEDETGKKKVVNKIPGDATSIYGRFFSEENSKSWSATPEYNLMFLRAQQNYANDMLKARGHVFLNDVYDGLGMERSPAGAVVGWVKGNGDNYIDFGIFDTVQNDRFYDFVTGREGGIWLDFNVDGVVYDKI